MILGHSQVDYGRRRCIEHYLSQLWTLSHGISLSLLSAGWQNVWSVCIFTTNSQSNSSDETIREYGFVLRCWLGLWPGASKAWTDFQFCWFNFERGPLQWSGGIDRCIYWCLKLLDLNLSKLICQNCLSACFLELGLAVREKILCIFV